MKQTLLLTMLLLGPVTPLPAHAHPLQAPQTPEAQAPAYDVGSIKPNNSGSGSSGIHSTNDHYTATNISLRRLLEDAYGVKQDLISGVPKALDDSRFDVTAKIVDPDPKVLSHLTREQDQALLRPFLFDRFHLKLHTETRQLPVYELVVEKGGPKFKEAAKAGNDSPGTHVQNNRELTAYDIPMTSLANTLYNQVHRTVIDKTGLTGKYDLTLKWSPEDSPDPANETSPPVFTALKDQLGLKLQPAKGPVETLVVDHAEMPSADEYSR